MSSKVEVALRLVRAHLWSPEAWAEIRPTRTVAEVSAGGSVELEMATREGEPRWPLWTSVAFILVGVMSQAPDAWHYIQEIRHISSIPAPERAVVEEMETDVGHEFVVGAGATKCRWWVRKVTSMWVRVREECARPIASFPDEGKRYLLGRIPVGSRDDIPHDHGVRCLYERVTDTHVLCLVCMMPLTVRSS